MIGEKKGKVFFEETKTIDANKNVFPDMGIR